MKGNLTREIMVIIITFITLVGCSKESNRTVDFKDDSAKTVVENYFKYKNEKNKDNLLTTLTERFNAPNVVWGFENLDSTKIISIEEEKNEKIKEGYLNNGMGKINGTTENNLKIYKVRYEVKYKKDGVGPQDSGIYDWWYFLIRKDENSPWLIDDMGV
ncbi:DUF4829 domain-containing protein [Clostridium sp. CTA-7]